MLHDPHFNALVHSLWQLLETGPMTAIDIAAAAELAEDMKVNARLRRGYEKCGIPAAMLVDDRSNYASARLDAENWERRTKQ